MGSGSSIATPVLRDVSARGLHSISQQIASLEDSLLSSDNNNSSNNSNTAAGDKVSQQPGTFSIHNLGK